MLDEVYALAFRMYRNFVKKNQGSTSMKGVDPTRFMPAARIFLGLQHDQS